MRPGLHFIFAMVLTLSIVAHVAGALKHHIIDRDMTLLRMWPGRRALPQPPQQAHTILPLIAAVLVWSGALGVGAAAGLYGHATTPESSDLAQVQSDWTVQEGTLAIEILQNNATVAGQFSDWTAQISFDEPAAPGPAGDVEVTIAIPSLSLGTLNQQAMGADFFDSANFATATFSGAIEKLDNGYVARGPLTIKGSSIEIELPFTLTLDGDTATMTGEVRTDRRDFGIGTALTDEAVLGFGVVIRVDLVARRAASTS